MKRFIGIAMLLGLVSISFAEKVATFSQFMRPDRIMVDNNRIFIVEFPYIHIYSLDDYKIINKIGGRGEGPKEFMGRRLNLLPYPDHIIVNSQGKITYWKKSGEFIKEVKCPFAAGVEPCEDVFVALGFRQRNSEDRFNYQTIDVYDKTFKKLGEIDRKKADFQGERGIRIYGQPYYFYVMNNKYIVVTGHEGFELNVFDKKGQKLYTITRDYKKIKVTEDDKREVHDYFRNHPRFRAIYEARKHLIKISDYFPAIQGFQSFGDKLFIYTYHKKNGKTQFFVYDEKGKFEKELYLPVHKKDIQGNFPFTIENQKLYQFLENEEDDVWELHITDF